MIETLFCFALLMQNRPALAQGHRVRTIPYEFRIPIKDRLRPDDDVVKITREQETGSLPISASSPEALISYLVSESDVLAIVNITDVSGILVEDGTWIGTQVTATISEVFKHQYAPLRIGNNLRFEFDGGHVTIGQVIVTTGGEEPTILVGRSYLLFAQLNADNGRLYPKHVPLLIEGTRLSTEEPFRTGSGDERDPLDGYSLQSLREQLLRVTK